MEPIERTEVVAGWGGAQLLRFSDGHFELRGGTEEEKAKAWEWLELFMPDVAGELREKWNRER